MLELTSTFPHELTIDGEIVRIRVRRLPREPLQQYEDKLRAFGFLLSGPERPADAAAARERDQQAIAWMRESLPGLVTIEPGQIVLDGRDVTDVGEFIELFAARADGSPVGQLLLAVLLENTLSEQQKRDARAKAHPAAATALAPDAVAVAVTTPAPSEGDSTGRPDDRSSFLGHPGESISRRESAAPITEEPAAAPEPAAAGTET